MISRIVLKDMIESFRSFTPDMRLSSGIVAVIIVSLVLFAVKTYFGLSEELFSLGTTIVFNGEVHKLVTYSFHHKTVAQLLLSIGVLVPLCGGVEKSVGTVRFLLIFLLLSISTGVLYTGIGLLLFGASSQNPVEGLVPVSLSLMGMATVHSRMVKGYLFGVSVPMLALPWLFLLIITILVPSTVFLCNVIAIVTGGIYGKGWLSRLDLSDARAAVLDKKMPFRLLRKIGFLYVPASKEERRRTIQPPIIPTPGSYPVQAYAPASSITNLQATETTPKTYEGWSHSHYTQGSPIQLSNMYGHNHTYGVNNSFWPSHGTPQEQGHRYSQGIGHSHEHSCSHNQGFGHSHEHSCSHNQGFGHSHEHSCSHNQGFGHSHEHSCSHNQGFGHSHEHSSGHKHSDGCSSASQSSSHWDPVAQHPLSPNCQLSSVSVSIHAP